MPLTNAQHDAIMRTYDSIRTANRHTQNRRYEEVLAVCPQYGDIENEIITVSMEAAAARLSGKKQDCSARLSALNSQKLACLRSIGKPDDYLDDIYSCQDCHDTGYVDGKRCACFLKKAVDLVYHDSNLKNITASENFDTFSYEWYDNSTPNPANGLTPYNNMRQVTAICHAFAADFDKEFSNLLLFGDTGVGKTFLTNCIAKELLDTSHSVIYLTAIELFERFEKRDFSYGYPQTEEDGFNCDCILDCDLLIIDDLGTEVGNAYTNSKLFYCINERILRKKSVVISTNLSLADLRAVYSERIFSRLSSSYKILKLFGNDIRIMKRTAQRKP